MCFFWYITFLKLFFIQLSYDSLKKKVILVNDKRHWFMNFWEGYLAPQVDILYSTFSHFGYFILSSSKWVVSFTPPLFFFSYSVCFFVLFKLLPSWLYHDKQYFNVQKNLVHFFLLWSFSCLLMRRIASWLLGMWANVLKLWTRLKRSSAAWPKAARNWRCQRVLQVSVTYNLLLSSIWIKSVVKLI